MIATATKVLVGLTTAVILASGGCDKGNKPGSDNPPVQKDRILTLEAYSRQPYTISWDIQGGKGLSPKGDEHVASGTWKRQLRVSSTRLVISIKLQGAKKTAGYTKITEGGTQHAYTNVDQYSGVSISNYEYKP